MKQYIKLFILFLICDLSTSCKKTENHILTNCDFAKVKAIASEKKLPFCIVFNDSLSLISSEYIGVIKTYQTPINSAIYNFVNINLENNKWYTKLFSPQIYPVTCVFSPLGQLIDLIPGSSKESFAYIAKVINTMCPCAEFHYNQQYDKDKAEIINFTNRAIAIKLKVDSGHYIAAEIDSLFQAAKNPYILYLKLQNQLQFNKISEAKETAKKLLLFDSAQYLFEYYDEFMEANQLLDSTYNYKTAPLIESVSDKIELSECYLNHKYNLDINIINKGEKPLKISDILTSCSCIKLISATNHIVNSGKSLILKIEFTPDTTGKLFREIYIASNSIDTPIYVVSINATVQ